MESTNRLLQDITVANGAALIFNEEEISKEVVNDALAYKGLGIKLLSIAGGLLGSGFFLGFIFMMASGSETALIVIGSMAIIAAAFVNHKVKNTILDAACIGTYLTGFAMLGHGIGRSFYDDNILVIIFLSISLLTFISTTGSILNFIAILMINGCLLALININHTYQLVNFLTGLLALGYTLTCLYEARLLALDSQVNIRYTPLRNGLLFSFTATLFYHTMGWLSSDHLENEWISSLMIICAFLFLLHVVIRMLDINDISTKVLIYSSSLIVLVPAVYAPAICGSILVLGISFHIGHRTGIIIGCVALLYFTGQYYYSLNYTLLEKSAIMFGTGILFLTAWFVLKKQLKRYEQN